MTIEREFDVVLYGATGFTGGLCADYLARRPGEHRFAISGRNQEKLEKVRDRVKNDCGVEPGIIIANSADPASLTAMAARGKVVATTVGPYAKYGEPLVKACIEAGTDYADITGEPQFVDRIIERYHEEAKDRGLRLVSCCGFDSVPHDLGAYLCARELPSDAPMTVEGVVRSKGTFSGGTWHSAINAFSNFREHLDARKKSARSRGPATSTRRVGNVKKGGVRYDPRVKGWLVPLPTIDPEIVKRSARGLDLYGPEFRYGHYARVKKLPTVIGGAVGVGGLFALAQFGPTKNLLLKVKDPGEGPSAEERASAWFEVTFFGEAGGKQVRAKVAGRDPGYDETAKMLSECALCLAFDRERLNRWGVVTPAEAMAEPLIERLRDRGMTLEVSMA